MVATITPSPKSGEVLVNNATMDRQDFSSVTALSGGGFVVTWSSLGQDGSGWGIYGQRFNIDGTASGSEFRVNTATTDHQLYSSVTALSGGGFVVTWSSNGQDGSGWGIYGQRFNADGAASGSEFRVNTATTSDQINSSVTALSGGGFVVTWSSNGQDGSGWGIYGQRFNADGTASGSEFRVNTTTADAQHLASVTALSSGGFVVTWSSFGQDGDRYGIYGQRFNIDGTASGSEFRVNTATTDHQLYSSLAALSGGGFVVTWSSNGQDGSGWGIYGQRFNVDGTASGSEFRVNTATTDHQVYSSVTALSGGGFVVTWSSNGQDGSGWGIYGQRFNADGTASGSEFRVNDTTGGSQIHGFHPLQAIAELADGSLVVTWSGNGIGDGHGVFVRQFAVQALGNIAPTATNLSAAETYTEDTALNLTDIVVTDIDSASVTVTLTLSNVAAGSLSTGTSGAVTSTYSAATGVWIASGATADVNALLAGVTFNPAANFNGNFTVATSVSDGVAPAVTGSKAFTGVAVNDAPLNTVPDPQSVAEDGSLVFSPANGNAISIADVDAGSGDMVVSLSATNGTLTLGSTTGLVFTVGDGTADTTMTVTGTQAAINAALQGLTFNPSANYNGSADVTISTNDQGHAGSGGAKQDADTIAVTVTPVNDTPTVSIAAPTSALGAPVLVNQITAGNQLDPFVASLPAGGHLVVWAGNGNGDDFGVFLRRYDLSGTPTGDAIRVNTVTADLQREPSIAVLGDGSYIVTWHGNGPGDNFGIFARRFDAAGVPQGDEVLVNSTTAGTQAIAAVTVLVDGSYLISWSGFGPDDADGQFGRIYSATGLPLTAEFRLNDTVSGTQSLGTVSALPGGGFAATWYGNGPGDDQGIFLRRFDGTGVATSADTLVNTTTAGFQFEPKVATLADGSLVVAWRGPGAGDEWGIFSRHFDANGLALGSEALVNFTVAGNQSAPSIVALPDGGYVVTWQSGHIFGRQFDSSGNARGGEFIVNTTFGVQQLPALAALSEGGFIVAWNGSGVGDDLGVFTRRYGSGLSATEQTATNLKNAISITDIDAGAGMLTVTLAVDYGVLNIGVGTSGATLVSGNGTGSVVVSGTVTQLTALFSSDPASTVTFNPNTDTPPASATLTVIANDNGNTGGSALSGNASRVISIQAVNDAPVNTVPSAQTITENGSLVFSPANGNAITVADVDAGSGDMVVSLSATNGTLTLGSTTGLVFTVGDGTADTTMTVTGTQAAINAALQGFTFNPSANYNGSADITISTNDQGQAGSGGVKQDADTIAVTVTSVNNAPTVANPIADKSSPEDTAVSYQIPANAFADVDGDALSYTAALENGNPLPSWLAFDAGTRTFSGTPPLDFSGSLSVTVTANDGALGVSDTFNITITPVNDAPAIGGLNGDVVAYTENDVRAVQLDLGGNVTFVDVDSANFDGGILKVTFNQQAGDELTYRGGSGVTASFVTGEVTVDDGTGAVVIGIAQYLPNGSMVTLNASATAARIEQVIRAMGFYSTSENPSTVDRVLNWTFEDGDGGQSSLVTTVTVTAANDAPTATNLNAPETYTEDTALNLTNIVASDVDSANLTVTLTMSNVAAGALSTGTSGSVTSSYNAATGVWTASGATADVNALLAGVTFNPAANFNGNFTVATSVSDGVAPAVTGVKAFTGIAVEDPAVAVRDLFVTSEGSVLVGNIYANNGFGPDTDPDSTIDPVTAINGQAVLVGSTITLSSGSTVKVNADGTLTFTPAASLSALAVAGSGASNTQINESLIYTLAGGSSAIVTITVNGLDSADILLGTPGDDNMNGGAFDDVLIGYTGADVLNGGSGNDTVSYAPDEGGVFVNLTLGRGWGNAAHGDTYVSIENVIGTSYNDFIIGDTGVNRLDGGAGNDILIGAIGADVLIGGAGIDTASYEDNSGSVFVNLTLKAGSNNAAHGDSYEGIENLIGGLFDDFFIGDEQANRLDGAMGADTLLGAGGADTFVFKHAPGAASGFSHPNSSANVDTILDFTTGVDKIELLSSAFNGLGAGALNPSAFVLGTAAQDADDRIIYDQATGNLWFDADGSGSGQAVLFAVLDNKAPLAATDFAIAAP